MRNPRTYPKPESATKDTRQIETTSKKSLDTHSTIETLTQASSSPRHPKISTRPQAAAAAASALAILAMLAMPIVGATPTLSFAKRSTSI